MAENLLKGFDEGCVSLGKSENRSLIEDRLDHGASKKPKNPFPGGFIGSFDAPWSKRCRINDPFSDFPKETHPKLTYFFIIPLKMQTYVEETSSSISGCFINA